MQRVFPSDNKLQDELESNINDLFKLLVEKEKTPGNLCNLSIEVSPNANEGRCLISVKDFHPGSILIEIHKEFLINYRFVLNDAELGPFFNWYSTLSNKSCSLTRWDALLLLIIYSKHNLSSSSFMHKFTLTLPKRFDTPEYFDPRLIDLMPTHIKSEVKSRLVDLDEKYERIRSLLKDYSESKNKTSFMIDFFTPDEFRWAFCSMNSRVFYMEEENICNSEEIQLGKVYFGDLDQMTLEINKMPVNNIKDYKEKTRKDYELRNNYCCMAPLIDFANHSDTPNASGRFEPTTQSYQLSSSEEIKRGEEVSVTYGYHDNASLLIEYGFVMEDNAFDKLVFRSDDIETILTTITDQHRREEALRENLLDDLNCNSFTGPSWSLLKFLDIVSRLRNPSTTNLSHLDDAEIENYDDIRTMFISLLKIYESYCEHSRSDLENYRKNLISEFDHVDLVLKLIKCQLDIIRFNLDLAEDNSKWMKLF